MENKKEMSDNLSFKHQGDFSFLQATIRKHTRETATLVAYIKAQS